MTPLSRASATLTTLIALLVTTPRVAAHGGESHAPGDSLAIIVPVAGVIVVLGALAVLIGRLWPEASSAVDDGHLVASDGEELPHPRHPLQRVPPAVVEADPGADHEVLDDA